MRNNLTVKDLLDYKLEDDDTSKGGISFNGETLKDFIEDNPENNLNLSLTEINKRLKECGIKEIEV